MSSTEHSSLPEPDTSGALIDDTEPETPASRGDLRMRWLVAYRPSRQPRFGETARDVSAWTVVRTMLDTRGRRIEMGFRKPFPSRAAALHFAHDQARFYARRLTGLGA